METLARYILNIARSTLITVVLNSYITVCCWWSGGATALGEHPVPGRPTIWLIVGQGPTVFAAGAGGGCLDIFTLIFPFSPLSPSLWETARYIPKYCQTAVNNQPITVCYPVLAEARSGLS